jgi:hypothetical protein
VSAVYKIDGRKLMGRYQSNAGRRKCILFLVLCVVGLIIVLVYKPRSSSSSPVTPEPPDQDAGIVLDPLPDIPPRPGLEDGSEMNDLGWEGEPDLIEEDDRRILRRCGLLAI